MNSLVLLERVLAASVKRGPERPLTNSHLLNIVRMAITYEGKRSDELERQLNELIGDERKWGS